MINTSRANGVSFQCICHGDFFPRVGRCKFSLIISSCNCCIDRCKGIYGHNRIIGSKCQRTFMLQQCPERPLKPCPFFSDLVHLSISCKCYMIRLNRRDHIQLCKTIQIIRMDIFDMLYRISKPVLSVHFCRLFKKIQCHPHRSICNTVKPYLYSCFIRCNDLLLHFFLRPQRKPLAAGFRLVCIRLQQKSRICFCHTINKSLHSCNMKMRRIKIFLKSEISGKFCISEKFHVGKNLRFQSLFLIQFFQNLIFFHGIFCIVICKHFACSGNSVICQHILKIPMDFQHFFL